MVSTDHDIPFEALPADERLFRQRHSAAHVLAEAVLEMFPEAKYAIGPPIEHGFYYDFDLPRSLTPDDLGVLESRMRESVTRNLEIHGEQIPKDEARRLFANQPYKLELIDDIEGATVGHFTHGAYQDLCRGGHTETTGQIGAFKLTHVAGRKVGYARKMGYKVEDDALGLEHGHGILGSRRQSTQSGRVPTRQPHSGTSCRGLARFLWRCSKA